MPDKTRVLLTMRFTDAQLEKLKALSPRLEIVQKSIQRDSEDVSPLFSGDEEIAYGMRPPRDLSVAPKLRWVQLHSAGINHLENHPIWNTDIIVTTASGIHAVPIGEFAFALMLGLARKLPRMIRLQERSEWPRDRWGQLLGSELRGKTLGVVGYGSIGREVARIGKQGFCMRILALNRGGSKLASGFIERGVGDPEGKLPDTWYKPDQLEKMLPLCDYVVLAAPLTPQTRGLIGESQLRAMKTTSFLINIARGELVDEHALVRALKENWVAGAGLDVFAEEPLPRESQLWKFENVIISPHVAGATPHYDDRAVDLFSENLRRYLAGRTLLNVVDHDRGY